MCSAQTIVAKLYQSVIDDIITNVRDAFQDEGVDEAVLMELKQTWEGKLQQTRAVEPSSDLLGLDSIAQHGMSNQLPIVSGATALPPNALVPVQINIPMSGTTQAKSITVHVPAAGLQGGTAILQTVLNSPAMGAALALPIDQATSVLQAHINSSFGITDTSNQPVVRIQQAAIPQVDGLINDTSSDDDDDNDQDNDDDDDDDDDDANEDAAFDGGDVEPLNSDDDIKDEELGDLFDSDNVVVCQYDKITRTRNKWKLQLKDGIMNLKGKDYVFQKAIGDAEW